MKLIKIKDLFDFCSNHDYIMVMDYNEECMSFNCKLLDKAFKIGLEESSRNKSEYLESKSRFIKMKPCGFMEYISWKNGFFTKK